jgi:hypothetical protein
MMLIAPITTTAQVEQLVAAFGGIVDEIAS